MNNDMKSAAMLREARKNILEAMRDYDTNKSELMLESTMYRELRGKIARSLLDTANSLTTAACSIEMFGELFPELEGEGI